MSLKPYSVSNRFTIDKIQISRVNMDLTLDAIDEALVKKNYGYLCVTNARTTYLANRDSTYCSIQNNSLLTVPDGMPLVWIANNFGFKEVQKVSGIDLMDSIFKKSLEKGYSHYFYGCSENTINLLQKKLKEKYSGIDIKGAVSPPFQPIEDYDIMVLSKEVNTLKPTFFWCGLGAPKQEKLIALLQPHLTQSISIGVGLAFEYFADTVKRAPKLIEKLGLEWFYRLGQQPKKIFRFIGPFVFIFKFIIKSKLKDYD